MTGSRSASGGSSAAAGQWIRPALPPGAGRERRRQDTRAGPAAREALLNAADKPPADSSVGDVDITGAANIGAGERDCRRADSSVDLGAGQRGVWRAPTTRPLPPDLPNWASASDRGDRGGQSGGLSPGTGEANQGGGSITYEGNGYTEVSTGAGTGSTSA